MRSSARHALSIAPAALRHPGQALVFARLRLQRRRDARRRPFSIRAHADRERSRADAIEELLGVDSAPQAALLAEARLPSRLSFDEGEWTSRLPWIELLYLLVMLTRPRRVVETGVQWGYSTATMLMALPEHGSLDSIDLPNLDRVSRSRHAAAVPNSFRQRWTLHLGGTQSLLPRVLADGPPADLIVHDADHTYAGLLGELRAAWPGLRPGGMVAVDGVWSEALLDFAAEVGAQGPLLIPRASDADALGVMRRPEVAET